MLPIPGTLSLGYDYKKCDNPFFGTDTALPELLHDDGWVLIDLSRGELFRVKGLLLNTLREGVSVEAVEVCSLDLFATTLWPFQELVVAWGTVIGWYPFRTE